MCFDLFESLSPWQCVLVVERLKQPSYCNDIADSHPGCGVRMRSNELVFNKLFNKRCSVLNTSMTVKMSHRRLISAKGFLPLHFLIHPHPSFQHYCLTFQMERSSLANLMASLEDAANGSGSLIGSTADTVYGSHITHSLSADCILSRQYDENGKHIAHSSLSKSDFQINI